MSFSYSIIRKIQDTKIWPSIPAVEIEVEYTVKNQDQVFGKITIPKEEYELRMYFQKTPKSKIDFEKLWNLIEDYGLYKYSAGSDAAEMAAAEAADGEDI